MKINILIDNNHSFLLNYLDDIKKIIIKKNHICRIFRSHENVTKGDVLFILGCDKILKRKTLNHHKLNLVIHPSRLPKGKGGAALIWEILKNKKKFFLSMFNASNKIDAGEIVMVRSFKLNGHELHDEIRKIQAAQTLLMIKDFLKKNFKKLKFKKQKGNESYFRKRNRLNSKLDIKKSINDQFNLLRVCDNEKYPAFFIKNKIKYSLKIFKSNE